MSVGNSDPRTSTYVKAGMILGSENLPSTLYNALVNNTGFNMYSPVRAHRFEDTRGTFSTSTGTTTLLTSYMYLTGGSYDCELHIVADADANFGSVWLEIGGVNVSTVHGLTTAGTTISEKFASAALSSGWNAVEIKTTASSATEIYLDYVDSFLRQYGV